MRYLVTFVQFLIRALIGHKRDGGFAALTACSLGPLPLVSSLFHHAHIKYKDLTLSQCRSPRRAIQTTLIATTILFCLWGNAGAAIVLDSTTNANGSTALLTWSHTVGMGNNRILIVGTAHRDGNRSVASVTYGGTALTSIGAQNGAGNQNQATLWYLINPPTGTANISVSLSGSSDVTAGAASFTGVNQTTPLGTLNSLSGTSTTASVVVSSAAGEVVIDAVAANGDAVSLTAAGGQSVLWNTGTGTAGGNVLGGSSNRPGASSVTMSWTLAASKAWGILAVPIKPTTGLAIVKQTWNLNGSAPLGTSVTAPTGATLLFLIYVKNTTAGQVTDVRIIDLLDQAGFDYVSGSLVRTLAASPPADTATDKQIFDATAPGTGTPLSDVVDGDEGSAQDTGPPVGVNTITIGSVSGQANAVLNIDAHTTFAFRFQVKVK